MRVVVETAHQTRVEPMDDAESVQTVTHPRKKRSRRFVQVVREIRRLGSETLVAGVLRIQDAQRVAVEPPPAVLRQFRNSAGEKTDKRVAIGGAALGVAKRVQFE